MRCVVVALAGAVALAGGAPQAQAPANYDEARVPAYTLPDALRLADGTRVTDAAAWTSKRRPEILGLFQRHVFGPIAARPAGQRFEVRDEAREALGGRAIRRQVRLHFTGAADGPSMDLLIYLPRKAAGASGDGASASRVPAFVGLNFNGNHAVHDDPGIALSGAWIRDGVPGVAGNRATEAARGSERSRWPVETILERGYAVVTAYCGDLEPDHPRGWQDGVRGRMTTMPALATTMGAWAWGLSRALDYLATDPGIDAARVAVVGHSRLGKAAVWAGAQDERFAMVVSNDSGEGGAAITRRRFGETIEAITSRFPHWFLPAYAAYGGREDELPIDAHLLLALAAPRPLYVASASEDLWADPRGEFLGALHAEPVYALFGRAGLGVREMPPADTSVGAVIGYHVRTGKHDITASDWAHYLHFADRHLSAGSR